MRAHPQHPPGFLVCDVTGALHNAIAMLLGYIVQQQRGIGQHVELSLFDSAIALQSFPMTWYLNNPDEPPQRAGGGHWRHLPMYGTFETRDQPIVMMAAMREEQWVGMTAVPGMEPMGDDPRFATLAGRREHAEDLNTQFQDLLRKATRDEWIERFTAADVLCGPIYTYDDVLADPQFQHNDMVGELIDQEGGVMKILRSPIRLSQTPAQVRTPMPDLGQHTETILQELGYTGDAIEQLRNQGIVST